MQEKKLIFRFSGKIARLLGRESVSNEVTALFELVKNSYDADATKVRISFENFLENSDKERKIVISDNGDGMTLDEIENNWMVIGTYSKDKNQFSRKGRRVVGNKGIGRFAAEKLARKMAISSKPREGEEEIRFDINWDDYDKEDVTFDNVSTIAKIIPKRSNPKDHGTDIILTTITDSWNVKKIRKLRIAIASIVLPAELITATGDPFEVEIDAPDFEVDVDKKVHSVLFKNAPFKLTATLPENSSQFKVDVMRLGEIKRTDRFDLSKEELDSGTTWQHFGKCKFTLYFYPGTSKYEDWDKHYYKALQVSKISDYLKEIHGVKIYRDNFWVRPYGDKDNDWLDLEKDRVQSNLKVGNTQVIGFVQITKKENPTIMDTTTRERLAENAGFESLKIFIKTCIGVLNSYRIDENREIREKLGKKEHQNAIEMEVKYLNEIIDETRGLSVDEKTVIKRTAKNIIKIFADYKGETEQDYDELETKERTFRNLSSLGISSATTYHEINNIMAILREIPKSIINKISETPLDKEGIQNDANDAKDNIKYIMQFLQFIRHFVRNLKEDYDSAYKKQSIELNPIITKLFDSFKGILKRKNVNIDLRISPDNLSIYINMADLYSIMVNLLTNSIKALNLLPEDAEKKIRVTIEKESYSLKMLFSNNGPKIDDEDQNRIFELFVSKYDEGTGLGLPIVREILGEYSGTIEVKSKTEFEPGATFEIKIPLESIKQ